MNKHLVDFIEDELKNNTYYENIRLFAEGKDFNRDILSPIVNEYEDHIDDFGPYRFMDAIEDYISNECLNFESLDEVIERMWDEDFFELY